MQQLWTTLSFLLCTLTSLSLLSAVDASPDVSIASRLSPDGEIVSNTDLPEIEPQLHDEKTPLLNRHVTVNINSQGASIHHHHGHVHGKKHVHRDVEDHEEPIDPTLLSPRSSSSSSSSSTSFPTAFDTSLSNNFTTESCPDFFKEFLSDSTFTNCHAVSTLLRDSSAFFHILTSAASTSRILDIACAADVQSCASTMSSWASNLLQDGNCGQDYENGNPLVINAYLDMVTYEPIYRATCLVSPDTSDYCFVDAVTNTSNSANYDVYFLPYGGAITSAPFPTCNSCLQASLDVFSKWAQVDGQPLTGSYLPTATAINGKCGTGFANANITVGKEKTTTSSASDHLISPYVTVWAALLTGVALVEF